MTEETKPEPVGFYGIGKLAAESYVRKVASEANRDHFILRIGNAYGPGQLEDNLSVGLVARAVQAAVSGTELEVWGVDEIFRDYVHAEDVAAAFAGAALRPGLISGVYNVGSGISLSGREVLRQVEAALGRRVRTLERAAREFDVKRVGLDATRLREATGWKPTFSLKDGIVDLFKKMQTICTTNSPKA